MRAGLKRAGVACMLLASLMLAGCADFTNPQALNEPMSKADPGERLNRGMFFVHTFLDNMAIRPVTSVYRGVMPDYGKQRVSAFVHNLGSPVYFANSVLQGDVDNSFAVLWRFVLNTTVGLGGIFDVASEAGLRADDRDFGETLAVWGFGSGEYTFLPVFGPGTMRDSIGRFVDILWNPSLWMHEEWPGYAQAGLTIVDTRSRHWNTIEDIYRNSLDPYATFRSAYLQKRTATITKLKASRAARSKPAAGEARE